VLWSRAETEPSLGRMIGTDRRCRYQFLTDCGVAARAVAADNVTAGADVVVIAAQLTHSTHVNRCSSKKRSGGTPETTLRQRFLNNLGLHTHTQFLASHTSPLHRPWQKFGMEETSVQRGFNIATTIHNTGTNCTAHMQLATRKLLSVATMMTRLC